MGSKLSTLIRQNEGPAALSIHGQLYPLCLRAATTAASIAAAGEHFHSEEKTKNENKKNTLKTKSKKPYSI